jgi:hypothetical protein
LTEDNNLGNQTPYKKVCHKLVLQFNYAMNCGRVESSSHSSSIVISRMKFG